ncbi:MAG: hypothetical protein ACLPSH_00530 [Vulcanimicrobiaceae bacterium]
MKINLSEYLPPSMKHSLEAQQAERDSQQASMEIDKLGPAAFFKIGFTEEQAWARGRCGSLGPE